VIETDTSFVICWGWLNSINAAKPAFSSVLEQQNVKFKVVARYNRDGFLFRLTLARKLDNI
jgi:hypothetical protein